MVGWVDCRRSSVQECWIPARRIEKGPPSGDGGPSIGSRDLPNQWGRNGCIILAARRCQGDFNAPVLRARFGSSVWRNRIAVAMPLCRDKFGLHALRNQILHNGVGALLRKLQV